MRPLLARYAALVGAVMCLNFFIPRLLPGDPLDAFGGDEGAATAPVLTAAARAQLRAAYHLDQTLAGQFVAYLNDLAHADLGWSIASSRPVAQVVGERLPWTVGLVLGSVLVASALGIGLGLSAAWRGGRGDTVLVSGATALAALPEFLVAISLLLALSVGLGWFPLFGGRSPFGAPSLSDLAWHLALPALTLILSGTAAFVLFTRGAVSGVLGAQFLIAARARGLSEVRLALGHALPNALPPILALLGARIGHVLGGALVVERVFAVPGLGLLTFDAIRARDYPVLQAVFLLGSLGVLLVNVVVDAVRVRHASGALAVSSPPPQRAVGFSTRGGAVLLVLAVMVAAVGPMVAPYDPRLPSGPPLLPPQAGHVLGTDDLGQDLFSALLWGARASLTVAALVAVLATALAWSVGLSAGLFIRVEAPLMAVADVLFALPTLPLAMLVLALVGPSRVALVLVLGLLTWPAFARIVRAEVYGLRSAPHVEAARALGATNMRIATRHVLPATLALLPATLALTVRYALYAEATLAFLGLGERATPSWGTLLAWAFADPLLFARPAWVWWVLPPALCIVLVVVATAWCAAAFTRATTTSDRPA